MSANASTDGRINAIIAELLDVDSESVTPDALLVKMPGFDALELIDLTIALEEAFEIDIDDEDAEDWLTVADVQSYIARRLEPARVDNNN